MSLINAISFRDHIKTMLGSPVHNYAIAGLTSELVENGTVRMFSMENIQLTNIAPHSHRYDLGCLVLQGQVQNVIWKECKDNEPGHHMSVLQQEMVEMGHYVFTPMREAWFRLITSTFVVGEFYYMNAVEIHSINFSHDAKVLVFQGPKRFEKSVMLEPMGHNGSIPIGQTLPWMFQSD